MKLSAAVMEALKAFGGLDPASRPGLFPIRDGASFREKVMELAREGPAVERTAQPLQAVVDHLSPAAESVRIDPYAFSPPGMELS